MKTYIKQIEEPRLVIEYDQDAPSPRENSNIGYFFTKESKYKSPDGNMHQIYEIMMRTEDEAKDTENHIRLIKKEALKAFQESEPTGKNSHNEDLHIIDIFPIFRYEHSGVAYHRGTAKGFDYSNCGFYIITAASIEGTTQTDKTIKKLVDVELEEYTQWVNGEVFRFSLYDENGVEEESYGGYYSLDDIKEALGEEWKNEDMTEYLVS